MNYCATFAFDLVGSACENEPESESAFDPEFRVEAESGTVPALEVLFAGLFVREGATAYVRVFSYKFAESAGKVILHRDLAVNFLWRPAMSGRLLMLHNASLLNVTLIDCETHATTTIDFAPITVRDFRCLRFRRGGLIVIKRRRGNSRAALVGNSHLMVTLVVEGSYMLACIALSSIGDRWSKSPMHIDWPKLTFVQKSSTDKGKLSDGEITGELLHLWDYNAGSSPWAVRVNVLVPTWRQPRPSIQVPAEILILKFAMASNQTHPKTLISTIVQLFPTAAREEDQARQQLKLLSQSTSFVDQIPWPAVSITKSGRLFFPREASLFCSNLKSTTGDLKPRKVVDVGEELGKSATIFDVEPWSETVLVGLPGQLLSLKLRLDQG